MSTDPDVIRADIERTRSRLSNDVNSLTNEANPKTIVGRRVDRARSAVGSVKDKVMGTAGDTTSSVGSATSSATDTLGNAAANVGDAVASAPQTVRAQTQGNPLAAGLIAFGAGALLGGLLPASAKEAQAAEKVKDAAAPVVQQLGEAAKETAESLKEPAQQAVESVKSTATDAAATVKDEGTSAAQDVKEQAQDSADQVQNQRN
ncbi:MAG: DUF3618 domain-containing protein [Geodermatophilaceae bacterium]|nr:DUF3618 domain-containing protein [Geodermatophilaceae bacterium]